MWSKNRSKNIDRGMDALTNMDFADGHEKIGECTGKFY